MLDTEERRDSAGKRATLIGDLRAYEELSTLLERQAQVEADGPEVLDDPALQGRHAAVVAPVAHDQQVPAQAVALEAHRDDRVVVRPDRADVVADRVVAAFLRTHRADSPA